MATTVERIGIVETKVENLSEKLDDLKVDVKEMHDCLDKTRDSLTDKLNEMYNASCEQHSELAKKIGNLEQIRQKMIWMVAGGVAFAGILSGHFEKIVAFINWLLYNLDSLQSFYFLLCPFLLIEPFC